MVVSTCGFGSTGSSAISDYLMECENVQVMDKIEFTIVPNVDGLVDLEYHLMKQHRRQSTSITAIQRFQQLVSASAKGWNRRTGIPIQDVIRYCDEFVDSITQVNYCGLSPRIYKGGNRTINRYVGNSIILNRVIRPLEKKGVIKRNLNVYPFGVVRLSVRPDNFYTEAKRFLKRILKGMGADFSKIIVLDQAFSGVYPQECFPFFDDPYAVVVDRDPRDLYIFAREKLLSQGRFMPSDNVNDFIMYYRLLRDQQPYKNPNERVLVMHFEEMIYDYENATNRIDQFLGVTNVRRKSVFRPELSGANTNLIRRFPKYKNDIAVIEKELAEYLYPFEKYPEFTGSGEMFFGKSPLNK